MKSSILIIILLMTGSLTRLHAQNYKDMIVMCSDSESIETGRCTGSSSCRVCTDCSRCGYCNSGGSCGVCSSGRRSMPRIYNSNSQSYSSVPTSRNPDDIMADQPYSKYYLKTLFVVGTSSLNLRAGPSTKYRIITSLPRNTKLYFWAMNGNWVKVTVQSTEVVGYVYSDYVAVE